MITMTAIGSGAFSLNSTDWKKIGKGAIHAGIGATSIFVLNSLVNLDFGKYQVLAAGIFAILSNVVYKFISDNEANNQLLQNQIQMKGGNK